MIFIDSNIPMYLIGAAHPHKTDAQILLEICVANHERLVTDVEVFQEILHRYAAIERREAIPVAFDLLSEITDEVIPVTEPDVYRAKEMILSPHQLSARDAIHLAIMERHQIERVLSFDQDFDRWPGITRLSRV